MTEEQKAERKELGLKQQAYVESLITLFKTDPFATEEQKAYAEENSKLEEYLWELWVKHGSVLKGITEALETELDK
jgi:hypothetical protein